MNNDEVPRIIMNYHEPGICHASGVLFVTCFFSPFAVLDPISSIRKISPNGPGIALDVAFVLAQKIELRWRTLPKRMAIPKGQDPSSNHWFSRGENVKNFGGVKVLGDFWTIAHKLFKLQGPAVGFRMF